VSLRSVHFNPVGSDINRYVKMAIKPNCLLKALLLVTNIAATCFGLVLIQPLLGCGENVQRKSLKIIYAVFFLN
jgi:hypothetical protein